LALLVRIANQHILALKISQPPLDLPRMELARLAQASMALDLLLRGVLKSQVAW